MRIKFFALILILILSHFATAEKVAAKSSAQHIITMKSISFDPRNLEIHVGDSIVWQNTSYTDHAAQSDDGVFDTGFVHPKQKSKSIEFSKVGRFPYHCAMHGKAMSGVIVVSP